MNLEFLRSLVLSSADRSTRIVNHVEHGLDSTLLSKGLFRIFEANYETQVRLPHSHKYNFACLVLKGSVLNRVYKPIENNKYKENNELHAEYCVAIQTGTLGDYKFNKQHRQAFEITEKLHGEGDWYQMTHEEIHTIRFSKGALVLFIEGPAVTDQVEVLFPYASNGPAYNPLDNSKTFLTCEKVKT